VNLPEELQPDRNIPSLLASIGLAHDLGNPPFGHSGEKAIQSWFKRNWDEFKDIPEDRHDDFRKFEGNAQTFRLITRLQIVDQQHGLDLTYATLAAILKYPVCSADVSNDNSATKKHGFFKSEEEIVLDVLAKTGLKIGMRHPLTYIMEACDDIAYAIMDAEDTVKKKLVSFNDILDSIKDKGSDGADCVLKRVVNQAQYKYANHYRKLKNISPSELNDVATQRFRAYAILECVEAVIESFANNLDSILKGDFKDDLIKSSRASNFISAMKDFDTLNGYKSSTVLELEMQGYNVVNEIMDYLWHGIKNRIFVKPKPTDKKKAWLQRDDQTAFGDYVYGLMSENYRRLFESEEREAPDKYKEAQLLTDMVSGMTDQFAIDFHAKLKRLYEDKYVLASS
jgi:dGTPase